MSSSSPKSTIGLPHTDAELTCYLPIKSCQLGLGSAILYNTICARYCSNVPRSKLSARDCANVPPIRCVIIPVIQSLTTDYFVNFRFVCHVREGEPLNNLKVVTLPVLPPVSTSCPFASPVQERVPGPWMLPSFYSPTGWAALSTFCCRAATWVSLAARSAVLAARSF